MDKNGLKKYMNFRLGTYSQMNTYSIMNWLIDVKNSISSNLNNTFDKIKNWLYKNKTTVAVGAALSALCLAVAYTYHNKLDESRSRFGLLMMMNDCTTELKDHYREEADRWCDISNKLEKSLKNYASLNANKDNPALAQRVEFLNEALSTTPGMNYDKKFLETLSSMAELVKNGDFSRNNTKVVDDMLNSLSNKYKCGRQFVDDWEA